MSGCSWCVRLLFLVAALLLVHEEMVEGMPVGGGGLAGWSERGLMDGGDLEDEEEEVPPAELIYMANQGNKFSFAGLEMIMHL